MRSISRRRDATTEPTSLGLEAQSRREPYFCTLGLLITSRGAGRATVRMDSDPRLFHHGGVFQGGALASLLDAAIAHAALTLVEPEHNVATVELNLNYLRASNRNLICSAEVVFKGRSTLVATARIEDEDGNLIAIGRSTLKVTAPF